MAQQLTNRSGQNTSPSRYTEQRAPQFVGGETDPTTGNVISSSRSQAAQGEAAPLATPEPAQPTTRLADITYQPSAYNYPQPQSSSSSTASQLAAAAGGLAGALGKSVNFGSGESKSSSSGGGSSGGAGPMFSGGSAGDPLTTGKSNLEISNGPASTFNESSAPIPAGYDPMPYSVPELSSAPAYTPTSQSEVYSPAYYSPPAPSYSAPSYSAPSYSGGGSSGGDDGGEGAAAGTVICTELNRQKLLDDATFAAERRFGVQLRASRPEVYDGYLAWAQYVVPLMKSSPTFTKVVHWAARPCIAYMAVRMGLNGFPGVRGVVTFHVGWHLCSLIGHVRQAWRAACRVCHA